MLARDGCWHGDVKAVSGIGGSVQAGGGEGRTGRASASASISAGRGGGGSDEPVVTTKFILFFLVFASAFLLLMYFFKGLFYVALGLFTLFGAVGMQGQ
jgi:hypothetical protein